MALSILWRVCKNHGTHRFRDFVNIQWATNIIIPSWCAAHRINYYCSGISSNYTAYTNMKTTTATSLYLFNGADPIYVVFDLFYANEAQRF